jgi:hypothetical protein
MARTIDEKLAELTVSRKARIQESKLLHKQARELAKHNLLSEGMIEALDKKYASRKAVPGATLSGTVGIMVHTDEH